MKCMRQYDIWIDEVHRLPRTFLRDADTWKHTCVLTFDEDKEVLTGYKLPNIGDTSFQLDGAESTGGPRLSLLGNAWDNLIVSGGRDAHGQMSWSAVRPHAPLHLEWATTYWLFNTFNQSIMRLRAELNGFPRVCALLGIDNIEDVGQVPLRRRVQHWELVRAVLALNTARRQRRHAPANQTDMATVRESDAVRELKEYEAKLGRSVGDLRRREEGRGGAGA